MLGSLSLFTYKSKHFRQVFFCIPFLFFGCAQFSQDEDDHLGGANVYAIYDLFEESMQFGSIPWPDDLYLSHSSGIDVAELPGEDENNVFLYSLRSTLTDINGFSAVSPVYFYFSGSIDPSTLPSSAQAALDESASVFLMSVETGSPEWFQRIPIVINWYNPRMQLSIRPASGYPLRSGHKYVAVITNKVRARNGDAVKPTEMFTDIRDASVVPENPKMRVAYEHYSPVISALVNGGIARESIVALAVFHVQEGEKDFKEALQIISEGDEQDPQISEVISGEELTSKLGNPENQEVGLDSHLGIAHENIGWMIQGTFQSPNFISSTEGIHGSFEWNESSSLRIKRTENIPFSMWLPVVTEIKNLSRMKVIVFQHGFGGERSDALGLVNALVGAGYAIFAIDAPFHGLRISTKNKDHLNRFTGKPEPDGFGDIRGTSIIYNYTGFGEGDGILVDFNQDRITDILHPFYWRDATRQGVVDLMSLVHVIKMTDWSFLKKLDDRLDTLSLTSEMIGFIGVDIGAQMGVMLASVVPEIKHAFLALTGGHIVEDIVESPTLSPIFNKLLQLIDRDPEEIDYVNYHPRFWPEFTIWQTLAEAGDAIAYAPLLRREPINILVTTVLDDEVVSNLSSMSLADTLGVFKLGDEELTEALLSGNFEAGGEMVVRALYQFDNATHDLLYMQNGVTNWKHPLVRPFHPDEERIISNPTHDAVDQVLQFFKSQF